MNTRKTFSYLLKMSLILLIAVTFIFSIITVSSCSKNPSEINIGLVVPLTSGAADFGKWAVRGANLAIDELNIKYKDKGLKFRVIAEDSKMEPKEGLLAFKKLVDTDKIIGVITSGSGVVLTIAPEADKTKIVQLNYAAVSANIRNCGEYTFSLVNDANVEAKNISKVIYEDLSIKEISILYANAAYGVGTKESVEKYYKEVGGKIIDAVTFPEDFTDIRSQIIKIKRQNPKAVYLIATIKDSGRILKIAKEMGLITQWLSYNAFESPEVIKIAGEAANGVIYTSSNLFDLPNPGDNPQKFLKNYISKYNERPNLYVATAYDAVQLLASSYIRTNESVDKIKQDLSTIKNYQGASGIITFDEVRSVNKPVFLKIVDNGEFKVHTLK